MFQIESTLGSTSSQVNPLTIEAQESAEETLAVLAKLDGDEDAAELAKILTRPWLEGLLSAHDKIGAIKSINQFSSNAEDALLERLSHYSEPNIKIVRIEKTTEPLGATVKNEGEAVLVARIIRGGTAEASGLLHEGDEILEVNEVELRGKDVNEVCDILARMQGTLTFLVVPTRHHLSVSPAENGSVRHIVVHLKVKITYFRVFHGKQVCSLKMPAAIIYFLMFFILPTLFCLLYCILNCILYCILNCILNCTFNCFLVKLIIKLLNWALKTNC
jgi:hypothetical protein